MKAALYERTGSARDVLRVVDVERPEPGPGEVRVRIRVSGINPTDYKARSGAVPRSIDGFRIPHQDGAGEIDTVGPGVDPARVGQRVWVWLAATRRWGTAAQWTVVPEHQANPLPAGASFDLGASLGVPAMTAYHCLFADGALTDQTVLIAGGAGAVGHFAIELARRGGARVITTVSGSEKADLAAKAGAEHVINYTDADAADQIRAVTPHVDRIVEVALGANLALDLAVAGQQAIIVCYAATGDDPVLPVRSCMNAGVTLRFVLLYNVARADLERASREITAALGDHALTGLPVHRFGLEDIVAAHEAAEAGVVGKVLIDLP